MLLAQIVLCSRKKTDKNRVQQKEYENGDKQDFRQQSQRFPHEERDEFCDDIQRILLVIV